MGSLFGPASMMWRVNRHSVLLLGGRGALLMQLAHPLVAAAVSDHSSFRADPLGRLRRTLDSMLSIIFGDDETARRTAGEVRAVHERVRGTAPDGRPYHANAPDLLLWVYSTLVYSSLFAYEALVAPLADEEADRYYDETKIVARLFGIVDDMLPSRLPALLNSMEDRIASGEVAVTPLARELAEPILRPLRVVPRPFAERTAVVTVAMLPSELRAGYGLKLRASQRALLAVTTRASRLVVPRLPGVVRDLPAARRASAGSG